MFDSLNEEMKRIKGYPVFLGCILLTTFISEVLSFLYIVLIGYLEREVGEVSNTPLEYLVRICVLLIVSLGLACFFKEFLKAKLQKKINDGIKQRWMEQIFAKKGEELEKYGSDSFQFAFWKLDVCANRFYRKIDIFISLIMMIGMAVYIVVYMSYLFLLFIVGLIFFMFISQMLSGPLENKRRHVNDVEKKSIALMNNMFKGIDIVKNYSMEKPIQSMFEKNLNEIAKKQNNEKKYELIIYLYNQVIRCVVMIAIPGITAVLVRKGILNRSAIVLSSFSFFYFLGHMMMVMDNVGKLKQDNGDLKIVDEAMRIPIGNRKEKSDIKLPLQVEDFSADYEENTVFENKKLEIPDNGVIIVSGESGKGKSTFLKCLMGYKEPKSGYIFSNEKKYNPDELSAIASYAPQEPILLPISPYENIKMGKKTASDEEVISLIGDISPDLIPIYEGCVNARKLSGGQRQILGLIRTLISDAKVIVWDEPTSALNEEMINHVIEYVKKSSEKRTFLIASHDDAFLNDEFLVFKI